MLGRQVRPARVQAAAARAARIQRRAVRAGRRLAQDLQAEAPPAPGQAARRGHPRDRRPGAGEDTAGAQEGQGEARRKLNN